MEIQKDVLRNLTLKRESHLELVINAHRLNQGQRNTFLVKTGNIVNIKETSLYKEFLSLREEVLRHKWFESERAGYDVGFSYALIDWTIKFKSKWVRERKKGLSRK